MNYFTKKILLLLTLTISININSQEVHSKIIYKKKINIDLKKRKSKNKEAIKLLETLFDKMNKLEYVLLFNKKKSIFKEISKLNRDFEENSLSSGLSKLLGDSNGIYFTDKEKNKIYHQKEFESEFFLIEQDKISDWNITHEKKEIDNYTCFKATKNDTYVGSSGNLIKKKIIAWYTPQIPFNYGPLKYNGLPGLILELQNDKVIFYVKEIHLNLNNKENISKPKKGIKITQSKHDSIVMGLAKSFRKRTDN